MSSSNKNSHLTLNERIIIENAIKNGAKKSEIASTLGKDKSTIGKEIKLHRSLSYPSSYPTDCANFPKCKSKESCSPSDCTRYIPFKCSRRDRSPGACNGCDKYKHCRYDKFRYSATLADKDYRDTLVDSRLGVDMTFNEAKALGLKIKPLLKQGQSPYQIVADHPEFGICEKTLYNYIDGNVFEMVGITNLDLRRQVSRKISKKDSASYKKRADNSYLKGRTYKDYQAYIEEHPHLQIVQMDTIYNDVSNGPFLQTFEFVSYGFIFGLIHHSKTSLEMVDGMNKLEALLGRDLFLKYIPITLTDRGQEFSDAQGFECLADGTRRTRLFYCDPMQSGQKGNLENSHREIRYICPKGTDLKSLGLINQDAANLMFSHINSFPRESLMGKSPIEMMKFLSPDLWEKLNSFGIEEIEKDKVVLKPYLLKK